MREWLVIEDSRKNSVFAPDDFNGPAGYIPRDVAERILGRALNGTAWFSNSESEWLRRHPEWRETAPEWSPLGFWS